MSQTAASGQVEPPVPAPNGANASQKKGKTKKNADPVDATKAIQARISQLVQEQAGEKDQEAEIGEFAHSPFVS